MTDQTNRPAPLAAFDPLEDLFTECQLAARTKKIKRAELGSTKQLRAVFQNPENWERIGGVALIHAETGTLLGNYSEYTHRTMPGCRKLIHEHAPISIGKTEMVHGSWWLGERKPYIEASVSWTSVRECLADVQLPELGVAHPLTELRVGLYMGGIMRVELAVDTQFASPGGEILLTLPKGTNILECMSTDSKIAVRAELAL